MENRKGLMPGTRTNKRDSSGFPINGSYGSQKSGKRATAMREGRSESQTLTRAERKKLASARATAGAEGFHESVETNSNGVPHVRVPDPDGNAIALAEAP